MAKQRNNQIARTLVPIIVLLVGIGIAWGMHQSALADHERRIERAEDCVEDIRQAMTEMKVDVGRIRVILEQQERRTKGLPDG